MPAKKGSKTPPAKKAPPKAKTPPAKPAPPAKTAAPAKAAPPKLAPAPKPAPATKKSPPGQRKPLARPRTSKSAAAARAARSHLAGGGEDRKSKLGRKWVCFDCSAKFYDLNNPEPLCPKCGADQRNRPKTQPASAAPPPPPPRPRDHRPLALLDDDDATRDDEALGPEDLDLEFAGIADDDELGDAPDLGIGEEEEEAVEEE